MIGSFIKDTLISMGVASSHMQDWTLLIELVILLIFAALSYLLARFILIAAVHKIVARTKASWDDELFNKRLTSSACHIVPPVLMLIFLPYVFEHNMEYQSALLISEKILNICIVLASIRFINVFLNSAYNASLHSETLSRHPLKGLLQLLKLINICVGVIIIISLLINKNPLYILSGLGASAAILMLVFKDTILGLVAGVQLSANDMLKPGDWITAPKHGVDGIVTDLSLTTVKVRNWDMTTVTIPPYSLVSESFQNWRGMRDSGGRRVKRSINIDLNSITFLNEEQLAEFAGKEWFKELASEEGPIVNLHAFRLYLEHYLKNHKDVNENMTLLVRQLQPSNYGVPLELYFFTATTVWFDYERILAKILEHMFAMAHSFGLKIFQSPSGLDIKDIK